MRLYLVRHGSTALTPERRLCGRTDAALTDEGRREARALAPLLPRRIDRVVSSDLRRAVETAELLFGRAPDAIDPDWRELDFGLLEGLSGAEAAAAHPEAWRGFLADPTGPVPGGEGLGDVARRVAAAVARLRALEGVEHVCVVTHMGPIKAAVLDALGLPLAASFRLWIDPASLSVLDLAAEPPSLRAWNLRPPVTSTVDGRARES